MTTSNIAAFNGSLPLWEVSGSNSEGYVVFTVSLQDTDGALSPSGRDGVASGLASALTAAGFTSVTTTRQDVTYTTL